MANQRGYQGEKQVMDLFKQYFPGGWRRRGRGTAGSDLLVPESFPYSIEVKFQKHIKLRHLVYGHADLRKWWQQAIRQATSESRQPLLVLKVEGQWWVRNFNRHWFPVFIKGEEAEWVQLGDWLPVAVAELNKEEAA